MVVAGLSIPTAALSQPGGLQTVRPDANGPPTRVTISLFVLDVAEINDVAQTFTTDLVARMSWQDDRLALPSEMSDVGERLIPLNEVWHPRLTLVNRRDARIIEPDLARITPDGGVTFEARRVAELASPLDLHDFPFDTQLLRVDVASTRHDASELEIVVDERGSGRMPQFSAAGWAIELAGAKVSELAINENERVVRIEYQLEARREGAFFVTKVIVPLSLIVFMAASVFWVDPENVGPQLGISTASVLTLIAFQFSLVRMLPPVSYLTRIDLFLLGAMVLVFLALAEAIYTSHMTKSGDHEKALRTDRQARWVYLALFAGLCVVTLVL